MEKYFVYDKNNSGEKGIYDYIIANCTNELFGKIKKQQKNISDAVQFVMDEISERARKVSENNYSSLMLSDEEVFGIVIHYFEEESIEKATIGQVKNYVGKVAASKPKKNKTKTAKPKKTEPKEIKPEENNVGYEQISLLDLI